VQHTAHRCSDFRGKSKNLTADDLVHVAVHLEAVHGVWLPSNWA
jgi:hypothetical protein